MMLRTDLCLPAENHEQNQFSEWSYLSKVLMVDVVSAPGASQKALGHHRYFECIWGYNSYTSTRRAYSFLYFKKKKKSLDIEE